MIRVVKNPFIRVHVTLAVVCASMAMPRAAAAGTAEEFQSLGSIRSGVEAFVLAQGDGPDSISVTVGALDQRLRLSLCSEPLQAFWPPGARRIANSTVGVRCTDQKPWKIYVPARISVYKDIVVAARSLARGDLISKADLRMDRRDTAAISRDYISDTKRFIGFRVKRTVHADEVVTPRMVEAETTIKRGQKVALVASVRGLEVRMSGTALSNGAAGQIIKVRNLLSKRIIEGRVLNQTVVRVGP